MVRISLLIPAVALLTALAVPAQTRAELKRELRERQTNAKTADAMFEVAKWADENGLARDAKKLFEKVLDMQPEHPSAMDALVRHTRPRLLRAARRIGAPQDAEDSVQSAYYSLLRAGDLSGAPPMA